MRGDKKKGGSKSPVGATGITAIEIFLYGHTQGVPSLFVI